MNFSVATVFNEFCSKIGRKPLHMKFFRDFLWSFFATSYRLLMKFFRDFLWSFFATSYEVPSRLHMNFCLLLHRGFPWTSQNVFWWFCSAEPTQCWQWSVHDSCKYVAEFLHFTYESIYNKWRKVVNSYGPCADRFVWAFDRLRDIRAKFIFLCVEPFVQISRCKLGSNLQLDSVCRVISQSIPVITYLATSLLWQSCHRFYYTFAW